MQYTIEARELTNEYTHRPALDGETRRTIVDASDASDAISQFVQLHRSELVSLSSPYAGGESIATVKKEDSIYLVRVYAA